MLAVLTLLNPSLTESESDMYLFTLWITMLGFTNGTLEGLHSLYYQYTMHSQLSDNNIFQCTAVTLLNDTEIDTYDGTDRTRTPKLDGLKRIPESDWRRGTAELLEDHLELNNLFHNLMEAFGHNESGYHVLQWLHGCEGERRPDGSVMILNYTNKYAYDGADLMSFNWTLKEWSAVVKQAEEMEKNWNSEHGQNAIRRSNECMNWMKTYLSCSMMDKRNVSVLTRKSVSDPGNLTLTCMATGFYPKDVEMSVRKLNTSIPEHLITSSGVRPNGDGTYQLRKRVEIQENESAQYDCYVTHSSVTEPIIQQWDVIHNNSTPEGSGAQVVVIAVLAVVFLVFLAVAVLRHLKKKERICVGCGSGSVL